MTQKISYTDIYAFARKIREAKTEGDVVAILNAFKEAWVVSYASEVHRLVDGIYHNASHMKESRYTHGKPEWMA